MTDFRGVGNTLRNNTPSEKIAIGEARGNMRVAYDEFTFTAIIDTTDTLFMMEIPQGARVYDAQLKSADLGDTGDVDVGWQASADAGEAADADGFFAAIDVNAAADINYSSLSGAAPAGVHKKFTEPVQVVIVPTQITTATAGTISLAIFYAIE